MSKVKYFFREYEVSDFVEVSFTNPFNDTFGDDQSTIHILKSDLVKLFCDPGTFSAMGVINFNTSKAYYKSVLPEECVVPVQLIDDLKVEYPVENISFTGIPEIDRDAEKLAEMRERKKQMALKYPHYYKSVEHLDVVDIYDIIELFGVENGCIQHALKKVIALGNRGHKDTMTDLADIRASLDRFEIQYLENQKPKH